MIYITGIDMSLLFDLCFHLPFSDMLCVFVCYLSVFGIYLCYLSCVDVFTASFQCGCVGAWVGAWVGGCLGGCMATGRICYVEVDVWVYG